MSDAADIWGEIIAESDRAHEIAAVADATMVERAACLQIVESEIAEGRARGLSDAAPAMRLLARVRAAIAGR